MKEKKYPHITIWSPESEPDILYNTYAPHLEIDKSIAQELVNNRLDFTGGKNHYVVVDFTNVKSVTKEAREFMNSANGGLKGILGGAFVSNNVVANMFINLYLRINKPSIPAKYFASKEEALNWLKALKKGHEKQRMNNYLPNGN